MRSLCNSHLVRNNMIWLLLRYNQSLPACPYGLRRPHLLHWASRVLNYQGPESTRNTLAVISPWCVASPAVWSVQELHALCHTFLQKRCMKWPTPELNGPYLSDGEHGDKYILNTIYVWCSFYFDLPWSEFSIFTNNLSIFLRRSLNIKLVYSSRSYPMITTTRWFNFKFKHSKFKFKYIYLFS